MLFCFPITLGAIDINRDSLIEELKNAPDNNEMRAELLFQLTESYAKDVPAPIRISPSFSHGYSPDPRRRLSHRRFQNPRKTGRVKPAAPLFPGY